MLPKCQTAKRVGLDHDQDKTEIFSVLIWVQTVCKSLRWQGNS